MKLAGALLALAYLGFYFYVGITGKLPYMHETVHIMRYGDRKKWVAGGMTAAMILGICINSALNDLNLKRIRKESFLPLFFTMIFPYYPPSASGSFSWIMAGLGLAFMPVLQSSCVRLHGFH